MDLLAKVEHVDLKPAKRMKKRRELDALISKQPSSTFRSNGRTSVTRNGKHELLRNDSDSSDVEEFTAPEKSVVRKRVGQSMICSLCWMVCSAFLLLLSLLAIGGLVWMYIQLKKDVDELRTRLDKAEAMDRKNNIPNEIQKIEINQETIIKRLDEIENGDQELLMKIQENITSLRIELESKTKTSSLNAINLRQITLSQQVKDLSKSVAELGSNLATLEQNVQKVENEEAKISQQLIDLDAGIQSLQLILNNEKKSSERTSNQDLSDNLLLKDLTSVNYTLNQQIDQIKLFYADQQASIFELSNYTRLLHTRVTYLEVKPTTMLPQSFYIQQIVTTVVETMLSEFRNVSKEEEKEAFKDIQSHFNVILGLIQTQVSNNERNIFQLNDELIKLNISFSNQHNLTDLNTQILNSKFENLVERLKVLEFLKTLNSKEVEIEKEIPLPPPQPLHLSPSASSSSSSSKSSSLQPLSTSISSRAVGFPLATATGQNQKS